jgi:hypothetical protein
MYEISYVSPEQLQSMNKSLDYLETIRQLWYVKWFAGHGCMLAFDEELVRQKNSLGIILV